MASVQTLATKPSGTSIKAPAHAPSKLQAQLTMLGPGPMLPEIDGLPGAKHSAPASKQQGEGGTGEGRADGGGPVIGALVVVALGA